MFVRTAFLKIVWIAALIFSFSLVGCGGDESGAANTSEPKSMESDAAPTSAETKEPKKKMFAKEQQLIKDAKGMQALLDQDADRKKDAVKNMN